MKRWLHLIHRWLGIGLGLLVLTWLFSGLVMLWVPRPQLQPDEALRALSPLPTQGLLAPAQAFARAGLSGPATGARLSMRGEEPVWLFQTGGPRWQPVSAVSGQRLAPLQEAQVLALAQTHAAALGLAAAKPETQLIQQDQWSIYGRFNSQRPLWRVALQDEAGTELYYAQASGELVLDTSRWERGWNWLGTVTHWLYFTPLRADVGLWRQLVLWSSGAALLLCCLGLWLGLQRLRLRGYASGSVSPYRERWQRWHHLLGLGAGAVLAAWLFSGWLSMDPWGWPSSNPMDQAQAPWQGEMQALPAELPRLVLLPGLKQVEWLLVQGQSFWRFTTEQQSLLLDAQSQVLPQGLSEVQLLAALQAMHPQQQIRSHDWLTGPDLYYYGLRHQARSFPVLRACLADARATCYYLDPQAARVAQRIDHYGRVDRWLFNALHRWDWPPLQALGPLRDVVVVAWTLAAAGLCLAGCVLGWRRLRLQSIRKKAKQRKANHEH